VQASRYLKSDLDFLGVSVPGIRAVITEAVRRLPAEQAAFLQNAYR
jgi:hypothetical protein